jgi:P-type Mg2+ transporter
MDVPGLTSDQAAQRLAQYGPNEAVRSRPFSAVRQFLGLFANPLVLILLSASAVSASLDQHLDASIIAAIVVISVLLNFWQSFQSQRAADRLRASVMPVATVLRDGRWQDIPVRVVVPGDIIRLSAGDLVPADGLLLESRDLSVQQSMLTGESLPADKHATVPPGTPAETGPDAMNRVFLGTSVISGTALLQAEATGPRTQFGDIAARLSARPPATEFEHGLRRFSLLILRTTIVLVLFILLVGIALKHDPMESLLFAVALGVGLTPEFLPMIASITLTQGALRMARDGVIVKHLPAIQNFGSIDVLCSDKTGTLTAGQMRLESSVGPTGAPAERPAALAWINSHFETGIRSPLDAAILQHGGANLEAHRKVDEIPFDFERRRLSVVVDPPDGAGRHLLITKGAPESVLALATHVDGETPDAPRALDAAQRRACQSVHERLSANGLRVLAVGYRWVDPKPAYAREDERDLTLAGFLSFADPVLPGVPALLSQLEADGVSVKILTGDNDLVARHVCRSIGIDDQQVMSGEDMDRLDDGALSHVVEQTAVFTRVSPAQKNRILVALHRRGHVVGYIGDGINDAPSLRTADVGISVVGATDVAREAADVILSRSSLAVLHRGILEGRRASGNMMKYLLMGTSSNFGNMFSMAAASLFLPFLPMLPTQILLNNFLYDLAQITIPGDNVDASYLRRPQRWNLHIIRDFMLYIGPISSVFDFLTFYILLHVFHAGESLFHTGWFIESLATQTLVLFVIRTMGSPWRSRPSGALTAMTLAIVAIGAVLPLTPVGHWLGFVQPPFSYLLTVGAMTLVYLGLVDIAKRVLVRRL